MSQLILQPAGARLGDYLNEHLRNPNFLEFGAAVAFVKYSGVRQIEHELSRFSARGIVRIAVGVDCQGSSVEGLTALLQAVEPRGQIWIFHNEHDSTFHPKIYTFRDRDGADVVIGSGNLTAGGLFTNYEASIAIHLGFDNAADDALYRQIEGSIRNWTDPTNGTALRLGAPLIEQLALNGYILTEAQQRDDSEENARRAIRSFRKDRQQDLFARVRVPRAPVIAARVPTGAPAIVPVVRRALKGFVMSLQQTDTGHGQVRKGKARRSPEIFVPLAARDYAPEFWGWRRLFREDPETPGKWDRRGVRVRLSSEIVEVNMMTWPVKHDFRLRNEKLRSAGSVGDILRIEAADDKGYEYIAEIVPRQSTEYDYYDQLCAQDVRNSRKRWGYYL